MDWVQVYLIIYVLLVIMMIGVALGKEVTPKYMIISLITLLPFFGRALHWW